MAMSLSNDFKRLENYLKSTSPLQGKQTTSGIDFILLLICPAPGGLANSAPEPTDEVSKNPNIPLQGVQATLASVSESTIRKTLHQFNLYERCVKKKNLRTKKYIIKRLKFAIEHIGKDEDFWNNVLKTDSSKSCLVTVTIGMLAANQIKVVFQKRISEQL